MEGEEIAQLLASAIGELERPIELTMAVSIRENPFLEVAEEKMVQERSTRLAVAISSGLVIPSCPLEEWLL